MSFLVHHGVKGMHWGVRRYQNYDGTRIGGSKNRIIDKGASSSDFTIRKGTTTYRVAGEKESYTDHKRKYMSVTDEDRELYGYGDMTSLLNYDTSNGGFGEYTSEFIKDARVAKGEKIVEDLIDKYGDVSIQEAYLIDKETRSKFANREDRSDYLNDEDYGWDDVDEYDDWTKVDNWSRDTAAWEKTRDFVWNMMETKGDTILEDYKREGYDAIIDPYDYIANVADMPLIVIDPAVSIKNKSYRKLG